ncbi:unnamed protein product [Ectocarpus sp. CCAP 1310/34]|nr:unnamed protein product [Ectocarpus sp. CCAP 1310/34]
MTSDSSGSEPEKLNPEQQLLAVANLKAENEALRARIAALEAAAGPLPDQPSGSTVQPNTTHVESSSSVGSTSCCSNNKNGVGNEVSRESLGKAGMTAAEIARYSRHLLVPAVGVEGQRNLLDKTCLVIGAGGLASAVLPYLAGAGVGHIKIIDFDKIETSNLHRQVLYREGQAGQSKAKCAAATVRDINSSIRCTAIEEALTHDNAMGTLAGVDLVVDASDNPRTRYLVNDACVLSGTPLVSGSALGMEGQVSVFHHRGGPCYRCVFPAPLAAEAGRRCSDNGVLGTIPGVIGCLQATEALKVLGGFGSPLVGRLCTYDGQDGSFYTVRLRPRSKTCAACGDNPTVRSMEGSKAFAAKHGLTVARVVPEMERVPTATCQEYADVVAGGRRHVLLDVRVGVQFAVCALDDAVNVPLSQLEASMEKVETLSENRSLPVYCICRRGVDSKAAVSILAKKGFPNVMDVSGGLTEWARTVDREFPMY